MGSIKGHYEWDDDSLTPGTRKSGGLHQNLFDSDGNLKGHARFIPAEDDDQPVMVTETVYVHVDERRTEEDNDEFYDIVAQLVITGIVAGYQWAKPQAQRWWRETLRPTLNATRVKRRARRAARKSARSGHSEAMQSSQDLAVSEPTLNGHPMSRWEALARYLSALAAQAYSEQQLRLVKSATIVNGDSLEDALGSLLQLPTEQIEALVAALATNPSMLSEENLAQLASILDSETSVRAAELTSKGVK